MKKDKIFQTSHYLYLEQDKILRNQERLSPFFLAHLLYTV